MGLSLKKPVADDFDNERALKLLIEKHGSMADIPWTTMDDKKMTLGQMATPHLYNAIDWHHRRKAIAENQLETLYEEAEVIKQTKNRHQPDGYETGEIPSVEDDIKSCEFIVYMLEMVVEDRNRKNRLTKHPRYLKMKAKIDQKSRSHWRG